LHIFFSHIYPYNTTLSIPLIIKSIKLKNNVTIVTIAITEIKACFTSLDVGNITLSSSVFASFIDLIMRGILKVVL